MYKSIVFDLGGVMVDFAPRAYLVDRICNEEIEEQVYDLTFGSEEWKQLDAGLVSRFDGNQAMLRNAKAAGYSVYYLSNIPEDVLALLKERGVLDRFDGGVASCEVHINKPDPRIYQALLDKYGLKASECVFIDDNLANVQAAFTLGFVGIRMKESVGTLIRSLATCNVALR